MAQDETIKYFAYVRKSSEGQERQALSIPAQKEKLLATFPNLDIEFVEEEKSAFKPYNRPKFANMLERIDRGERTGLIGYHPDRISRNEIDASALTYRVRKGAIADLKFTTYFFENNPEGIWMLQMALSQSQYESAKKGRDVKRGLEMKARMGWRPSGAPVGWLNTPLKEKGFKTIEKDPERFILVRRMWDLMLTGQYSASQIWRLSIEWGLTTVPHRNIGGKHLTKSYVFKNIFNNPFYYGWFQYRDRDTGQLVWQKGEHEPMVTEEEYNRVQVLLGRTNAPRPKTRRTSPYGDALIECAVCSSAVTFDPKTKTQKNGNVHYYSYHHCTHKKDPDCVQGSVTIEELEEQVQTILGSLTISPRFRSWAIKHLHEVRKAQAETLDTILRRKHKELEQVVNQLEGLLLKYSSPNNADGALISNDEYQSMKAQLVKRKAALETDLNEQGKEIEQWIELSEKTFNFACYASVWFEKGDIDTKRSILQALGTNLRLKDKKLAVDIHPFFIPFVANKETLNKEDGLVRTSENGSPKRQKGTFVPSRPTGLRG